MPVLFIDPGRFRIQFALDLPDLRPDGAGGLTGGWTEAATFQGLLEPVTARPRFAGEQFLEETTHRVTIRHRPDVKAGARLRRGSRLFAILSVHDPDESGRYLVCLTREEQL